MAFTSTIKPYKFVNPSSISAKGGGATIIAGGKTITGGVTPQVKSARVTMLAINRIGMAMEGLGKTQQQIRDIIVYENKYLTQTTAFRKKRDGYRRDQKSEEKSESFGKQESESVAKEVEKKEKKKLGWLEKIFGPFAGIIAFVGRVFITQVVLRWIGDAKNTDKLKVFITSFSKVFKWAFNIAYKSTDAVLTGFSKVFGSSDKKGLNRFGEVLGGLGQLLIGIAGFKALGYLLNPFSLVNDIIGLVDILQGQGGGGKPGPDGKQKPDTAKPRAAVQKVAENYGDDAARYYDDLISRGKKPGDALKAVRGKFKKIPPKPKGLLGKMGDTFGDLKKSLGKGFENIKGFGSNITKGMRDKLVKSGEFLKNGTKKAMQPIAKKAYDFLQSKGIIKLANNLGEKTVGIIKKMPGYGKVMSKIQKEGGEAVLKKLGAKAIPVIGGLVNLYFAYDRLKNGDKSGAALEALSAILDIGGLFTGGATSALSMVIDGYLFGRDFFPDLVKAENAAFGKIIGSILGPIKGIKDQLPKVPFLKEGGIVNKPTIAMLGDGGPEAVVPLSQLGGGGSAMASTIIGATDSALSRMGAAGEIARSLIGGDLASAEQMFGASKIGGGGGDTLGKTVRKSKFGGKVDAGDGISLFVGDKSVRISDNKNPGNAPITLRGQLANVLGALIWVSKKDIKGGSSGGSISSGGGGNSSGDDGSIDTSGVEAATGSVVDKGASIAKKLMSNLGISKEQAAAIAGNFAHESGGFIPGIREGGPFGRSSKPWPKGTVGRGYGWAQWTNSRPGDRYDKFIESYGGDYNKIPTNEDNLKFAIKEMKTTNKLSDRFKKMTNVADAAVWFRANWERAGVHHDGPRIAYAKGILAKMAVGGALKKQSSAYMSRERKHVVEPQLSKATQLPKYAAGGSHRVIPDTPSTSWAAGIPLTYVTSKSGKRAEVAVPLAKRFQGFLNDLEATGYKIKELGGFRPDGPPAGNVDGKGPQYAHPYGAAIDINWTKNPAFVGKRYGDFPSNSGEIAKKYGLGWGSKFDDAMHFSAMKREYGAGIGGKEITGKTLGGSKEGADFKPGSANSETSNLASATPEEPQKDPFQVLEDAINRLNSTLGYTSPKTTTTETSKPSTTQIAFGKNTPQLAATGSSSAVAQGVNNMSTAVSAMQEASEAAGSTNIIPLPINTSVNTAAAFAAPQVVYPRTPITFSI